MIYLLTYIRIEIQINPEIWIRMLDHFRLRLDPRRRLALSEHSLVLRLSHI